MPTEFYYPISGATHDLPSGQDAWTNFGGANKNASTRPGGGRGGPMTHDDGTTTINAGDNLAQALNVDWPGPIASLGSTFTYAWRQWALSGTPRRVLNFTNAAGATGGLRFDVTDSSGVATTNGPSDVSNAATYRPGGGSWVASDFTETALFARVGTATGGTSRVTSVWGELEYTPVSGGFVFLLNLVGASALPFVGAMTDLVHFRRYLDWRERFHPRHTKFAPGEDLEAWLDVRAYRAPTFFLPA